MSDHLTIHASSQDLFQKECLKLKHKLECEIVFLRENPDDNSLETTGKLYKRIMKCWAQVERLRETGLNMVTQAPKSPLVLQRRSFWFIRPLADQTEFEDECDQLESRLDGLAENVYSREVENLWVAELLEIICTHIADEFRL